MSACLDECLLTWGWRTRHGPIPSKWLGSHCFVHNTTHDGHPGRCWRARYGRWGWALGHTSIDDSLTPGCHVHIDACVVEMMIRITVVWMFQMHEDESRCMCFQRSQSQSKSHKNELPSHANSTGAPLLLPLPHYMFGSLLCFCPGKMKLRHRRYTYMHPAQPYDISPSFSSTLSFP